MKKEINQLNEFGGREGLWEEYHETGVVKYTSNWKNDIRVGKSTWFDEEGNIYLECFFDEDENIAWQRGYHDGKKFYSGSYKEGQYFAVWKWFDKEGTIIQETLFI